LFTKLSSKKDADELVFLNEHGRAFSTSHQVRPMQQACINANVSHAGFHILRHTYGSRLAMAGVPMAVIAGALGHGDERITRKHYAHLSPSYVRDAIRAGLGNMGLLEPKAPLLRAV
jgi:integrase